MKTISTFFAAILLALTPESFVFAQPSTVTSSDVAPAAGDDMTVGEIRKIDKEGKKITLKHGEIKRLDMPAMTMVFRLREGTLTDTMQVGDKVQFKVEKQLGAYVVTELQAAK